jgi:hypothetical protein
MQDEFNFNSGGSGDGHARWLAARKAAGAEAAKRLNLPLDHEVEVWLVGGVRLRGKLQLHEEILIVEADAVGDQVLRVGPVPFTLAEMESCVRLD